MNIIEAKNLVTGVDGLARNIHENISFVVKKDKITTLMGASGSGKTVLFKTIINLIPKRSGEITILGKDNKYWEDIKAKPYNVCFQNCALFSSMTIEENIIFPLMTIFKISYDLAKSIMIENLDKVNLPKDVSKKYPSELSGGMKKRAALARSLVFEPQILFLDEPTAGLDPINARNIDNLVVELKEKLGISIIIITHDVETIEKISDDIIILDNGKILYQGGIEKVKNIENPWVKEFFGTK